MLQIDKLYDSSVSEDSTRIDRKFLQTFFIKRLGLQTFFYFSSRVYVLNVSLFSSERA